MDRIAKWSKKFGLGSPTGLILDSEKAGSRPFPGLEKTAFQSALA